MKALGFALLLGACAPVTAAMGPAIQEPAITETALVMRDGARLPLTVWRPTTPVRAVLIGLHGFNDYANAFAPLGAALPRRGIAVYAYDQRGFGAAPNPGLWPGNETLAADAETALALIRARHPRVPIVMAGESMGGAVLLVAARTGLRDAAGLVLIAPAVRGDGHLPAIARASLDALAWLAPGFSGGNPGVEVRPTDNPRTLAVLGSDPLVRRDIRLDAAQGLVRLMDAALDAARDVNQPTLVLAGRNDMLVPGGPIEDLSRRLPHGETRIYDQGFHLLTRDRQGARVIGEIGDWVLR